MNSQPEFCGLPIMTLNLKFEKCQQNQYIIIKDFTIKHYNYMFRPTGVVYQYLPET